MAMQVRVMKVEKQREEPWSRGMALHRTGPKCHSFICNPVLLHQSGVGGGGGWS